MSKLNLSDLNESSDVKPINDEAASQEKLAKEASDKLAAETEAKRLEDEKKKQLESNTGNDEEAKKKLEEENKLKAEKEEKLQEEKIIKRIEELKSKKPEVLNAEEKKFLEENQFEEDGTIWDEVDKQLGKKIEVDFGSTEQDTTEAAFKYVQAARADARQETIQDIANEYPDGYEYLLHLQSGGSKEDYFKAEDQIPTYDNITIDPKNVDQHKTIYKQSLEGTGLSVSKIEALVKVSEDGGTLLKDAEDSLKQLKDKSASLIAERETRDAEKIQQDKVATRQFTTKIADSVVTKGEVGKLIIPEKDRKGFYDFALDNIRYENGKFLSTREVTEKDIDEELQLLFFKYKKGDLSALVERKAITQNTKRLRTNMAKASNSKPNDQSTTSKKSITLNEL